MSDAPEYILSRAIHGDFEPELTRLDALKVLDDFLEQLLEITASNSEMLAILHSYIEPSDEDGIALASLAGRQVNAMINLSTLFNPVVERIKLRNAE